MTRLNVRQQEDRALERYRRAQARVEKARTKVLRISSERPSSAAAEDARIDLRTAELHARSVGARVVQATVAPSPENLLQLVVPAATADSDRDTVLQESLLIGLVAGIVLGFALGAAAGQLGPPPRLASPGRGIVMTRALQGRALVAVVGLAALLIAAAVWRSRRVAPPPTWTRSSRPRTRSSGSRSWGWRWPSGPRGR